MASGGGGTFKSDNANVRGTGRHRLKGAPINIGWIKFQLAFRQRGENTKTLEKKESELD